MESMDESSTTPEEIYDVEPTKTLEEQLLKLSDLVDVVSYRLDSMQRALHHNSFTLEHQPITIRDTESASSTRFLLETLKCPEENLTLGVFLKHLNTYLLHTELVDLNDLEIYLTPVLISGLHIDGTARKVPYASLLWHIPQVFN